MDYVNRYKKDHYSRITLLVPKDVKDVLIERAKEDRVSLSKHILQAYYEGIQKLRGDQESDVK